MESELDPVRPVLVLNGPNLNLLGTRQPEVYGATTLADLEALCVSHGASLDLAVTCRQSNAEGDLVTWLHEAGRAGTPVILNAGAYTHTSIAIHDAIVGAETKVIEVHISNIHAREAFRHHSFVSTVARGVLVGFGIDGYVLALDALARRKKT